jgi:tetratricopeptide (TPR) repeat protein
LAKGTWDPKTGNEEIEAAEAKMGKIFEAMQDDPKEALKKMDEFGKAYPAAAAIFEDMRYPLLVKADDPRAAEAGKQLVEKAAKEKNAQALNAIAWEIVDPDSELKHGDLDLAMTAAKKAVELTHRKDGLILDTLAWCYFRKGDTAKAIDIEKAAIDLAPEERRDELKKSLEAFEAKQKKS